MERKRQYVIKEGMKQKIKEKIKFKDLAEKVGVGDCYISEVMNARRKTISKTLAYAICKAISPDLEIEDLFNIF